MSNSNLEIQNYLNEHGFFPDEIKLDQPKVQRFVRDGGKGKRNAWLVGFTNFQTETGQEYVVCLFGDWASDEEFVYKSKGVTFSTSDQQVIEKKIREKKIKAQKEKLLYQKEAQKEAIDYITFGKSDGEFPYLKAKGFDGLGFFGAKLYQGDFDKPCICVPMRDSSGTLWGIQRIYSDGSKFYLSGQKTDALFHVVGGEIETNRENSLILCEGFATGISIHLATQQKVVVCFSAHNLEKVAKVLKLENPDCSFLIAGDDDRFNEKNAGRDGAEKAAIRCMGKTVYPVFLYGNDTGSDFNDLQIEQGLDAVKKQIEAVKLSKSYVRCLGHKEGNYYYTSSINQEISVLRVHGSENLTGLMPLEYWQSLYPKKSKKEESNQVDWALAMSELKTKCHERGVFQMEHVRGHGVWMDEKRVVVHLGNRLSVDGTEKGIHEIKTNYCYGLIQAKKSIHINPLSAAECSPMVHFLNGLTLGSIDQKIYLGGWLVASQLSGLLDWRPHLFLSGESGSGKSTLLDSFIRPVLGQNMEFASGERTTEAGLRQMMRSHAIPLMLDEFDLYGGGAEFRSDSVLGLIRQASSGTGEMVQGSSGGKHTKYSARFSVLISAVKNPTLNRQTDASRFLQVEMQKNQDKSQWEKARGHLGCFDEMFSQRFFSRVVSHVDIFLSNSEAIRSHLVRHYSQRLAQLYAPTLSGWLLLIQDGLATDEQVEELCESIDVKEVEETDHESAWENILGQRIKTQSLGEALVSTLLDILKKDLNNNREIDRLLQVYGIRKVDQGVFIHVRNPQMKAFFKGTDWSNTYSQLLKRVGTPQKFRINKRTEHGILIPY